MDENNIFPQIFTRIGSIDQIFHADFTKRNCYLCFWSHCGKFWSFIFFSSLGFLMFCLKVFCARIGFLLKAYLTPFIMKIYVHCTELFSMCSHCIGTYYVKKYTEHGKCPCCRCTPWLSVDTHGKLHAMQKHATGNFALCVCLGLQ